MAIRMKQERTKVRKIQKKKYVAAVSLCGCLLLAGCQIAATGTVEETAASYDTGFIPAGVNIYDSADRAVVVKKTEEENTITLFNHPTGRNYTLHYDGTTQIRDKYGEALSMAQIDPGDIVEVTFLKSRKKLRSISLSADVWTNTVAGNYEFNQNGSGMIIAKDQYALADNVMVVSEGEQAELVDINVSDTLLLQGIGRTIYSITVEKGHGYLRLANEEYFIGGWIEIGQALIKPVEEDMLLAVPEGSYQVLITNHGGGGTKQITVNRNEEITLDVGDLKGEETKQGSVVFALNPVSASVYIDGDKVDTTKAVEMDYGIHQMIVRAEGYKTITQYIKVGQAYATLDVVLEAEEGQEETSAENGSLSDNTLSGNSLSGNSLEGYTGQGNIVNATGDYRIYITAPEGAEVYYDGTYAGVIPVNLKKQEGLHVVTLRKNGCQTRSFTIQVDGEAKDISWAFSELEASQ